MHLTSGLDAGGVPVTPWSDDAGPELTVSIGRTSATVVVTVHGCLDTDTAPILERLLGDLIVDQGNLSLVVDVQGLRVVDPRSLDVIDAAVRLATCRGGTLTVAGTHPRGGLTA